MPRVDEFDWVFDFVLQFLESDKFDASVMNFLDEKCDVFDDEEENKFIYTTIHKEFCDHIEALISSNLGELGISNEMFLDACEKGRTGRDINTTVFERLIAMDDFQTFKKIMTKRNTELQLESLRSYKNTKTSSLTATPKKGKKSSENSKEQDYNDEMLESLLSPEELQMMKDNSEDFAAMQDEDMQDLLFQSLMEMEMIHRQEELEYAELERAMIMSLLIEEERLKELTEGNDDCFARENDEEDDYERSKRLSPPRKLLNEFQSADAKDSSSSSASTRDSKASTVISSKGTSDAHYDSKDSASSANNTATTTPVRGQAPSASDPKPLKGLRSELKPLPAISFGGCGESKPLPPIGFNQNLIEKVSEFDEKKRQTEDALRRTQAQLSSQRAKEEELRQNLSNIDPDEAQLRAKHMKEQRDLLIAKKKAERERAVQIEAERKAKLHGDSTELLQDSIQRIQAQKDAEAKADAKSGSNGNNEVAEMRRNTMRNALARRMKMDLIESEENKKNAQADEQYNGLDVQLQQVNQLREDNRKREYILAKQLERQQAQIAHNIKMSAAALSREGNDF